MLKKNNKTNINNTEILIPKEHSMLSTYGELYYEQVDKIKDKIKKSEDMTYIHFRAGNNFYNPESNMRKWIYPITKNTQFLNLKNEEQFQNFITKGLNEENINNEEIHSFLNMFIHQVYKCINTKFYHKEKIELSEIFSALYDFKNLFEKYNKYTDSEIHDESIREYISKMYNFLKIESLLKNIETKLNITHNKYLNIAKIVSEKPIELFDTDDLYNKIFFYSFFYEIISNLISISESKKNSGLTKNRVYIIFDKYPKNLILEPCLYSQLRALGIKLIFPKPEDLSYDKYLHKNSLKIDIN